MSWTHEWSGACALLLSVRARNPALLASPQRARLLQGRLARAVARHDLPIVAWLILPDAWHVVGACRSGVDWPRQIGRIKQAFARSRGGVPGAWQLETRVRPLRPDDAVRVLATLRDLPVRRGLVDDPADWPWASRRGRAGTVARQPSRTGVSAR